MIKHVFAVRKCQHPIRKNYLAPESQIFLSATASVLVVLLTLLWLPRLPHGLVIAGPINDLFVVTVNAPTILKNALTERVCVQPVPSARSPCHHLGVCESLAKDILTSEEFH